MRDFDMLRKITEISKYLFMIGLKVYPGNKEDFNNAIQCKHSFF